MTTETNTDTPRRPIGQTLWRYTKILLGVVVGGFLLVHVGCTLNEMATGERIPRYIYTDTRTELVFDGNKVEIEERVECRRKLESLSHGVSLDFLSRSHYLCYTQWLAHHTDDGGVLLVRPYRFLESWPPILGNPDLTKARRELMNKPPAVVWLDDPVNPKRGELYFSTYALAQPGSRLTALNTKLVDVHDRTYIPMDVISSENGVPWLFPGKYPTPLIGFYAILYPKQQWSVVEGLEEILAQYDKPTLISIFDALTDDQWRSFVRAVDTTDVRGASWMRHNITDPQVRFWNRAKYERSTRVISLVREASSVYRLDRSQPRGVHKLSNDPYSRAFIVKVGGLEFEHNTLDLPVKFIYDPEYGELIKIGASSFKERTRCHPTLESAHC
jgi:hypothetical protein